MGSMCSATIPLDNFPPIMSPLSDEDKRLVQDSWPFIYQNKETVGMHIYYSFLTTEKDMRAHFPKITETEGKPDNISLDQTALIRHAVVVMEGINVAVECLPEQARFDAFLGALGETHYKYGVKCDTLQKLFPAFIEGLSLCLKERYTRHLKLAWKRFFFYMISVMKVSMIRQELMDRWDSDNLDTLNTGCFDKFLSPGSGSDKGSNPGEDNLDTQNFKKVVN